MFSFNGWWCAPQLDGFVSRSENLTLVKHIGSCSVTSDVFVPNPESTSMNAWNISTCVESIWNMLREICMGLHELVCGMNLSTFVKVENGISDGWSKHVAIAVLEGLSLFSSDCSQHSGRKKREVNPYIEQRT